jgi:hypothetical protein
MIWDFCPDMMHVVKTFFERLVIGVFSGARRPTFGGLEPTKPPTDANPAAKKKYKDLKTKYDADKEIYARDTLAFDECKFDEDDRKIVDERVKNLVGYPDWIKTTLVHTLTHTDTH